MIKRFCVLYFVLFSCVAMFAQTKTHEADSLFSVGEYVSAGERYQELVQTNPFDPWFRLQLGLCAYFTGNYDVATTELSRSKKFPQAKYYLAEMMYRQYNFAEAKQLYEQVAMTNNDFTKKALLCLQQAEQAQRLMQAIDRVEVVDSVIAHKTQFFEFYKLSNDAGRLFSVERPYELTTLPHMGYMTQRQDRMIFSDTINGQSDLFISNRLIDGWSAKTSIADNLNTEFEDNFPFLLSDGVTLYFASQGHNSIGGYDIFVTRFNVENNEYFAPENIGMPYNSPANDYLYAVDESKKIGYWATDRLQHPDSVIIYSFKIKESVEPLLDLSLEDQLAFAKMQKYFLYSPQADSVVVQDLVSQIPVERADSTDLSFLEHVEQSADLNFVVSAEIVIHSLDDFKSNDAKYQYQKGVELEKQKEEKSNALSLARKAYSETTDVSERKKMGAKILQLEKQLKSMPIDNPYFKSARNWEIKARIKTK